MRALSFVALSVFVAACSSEAAPGSGEPGPSSPAHSANETLPPPTAGDHGPSAAGGGPGNGQPKKSAGCGRKASGIGEVSETTLTAKGLTRTYHVAVPEAYAAGDGHPVVFVLHGAGDTEPETMHDWFPVAKTMTSTIGVYPQALPRTRDDGSGGNIPRWDLSGEEDLAFFDAMLAEIGSAYCVDLERVFATGFSSGGNFSQQLGCNRAGVLRAFGAVSGPGPFSDKCGGAMAAWMTHDVDDDALAIAGARASRDFWASANGCGDTWKPESTPECKRNTSCSSGRPVVYCETKGVGHAVADFAPAAVGAFFDSMK
jgi:polyhydroxybutyrate depolymerase